MVPVVVARVIRGSKMPGVAHLGSRSGHEGLDSSSQQAAHIFIILIEVHVVQDFHKIRHNKRIGYWLQQCTSNGEKQAKATSHCVGKAYRVRLSINTRLVIAIERCT